MRVAGFIALVLVAGCTAELGSSDGGPWARDGARDGAVDAALDAAIDAAEGRWDAGAIEDGGTVERDAGALDGGAARPLRVVVISDLNGSYGSTTYGSAVHAAVRRVIELQPDVVLSTGDMVAGQRAGLDYRAMWAAFHAAVSDPLAEAEIPLAVTPGNHDASGYSSFTDERAIFVDEWSRRTPAVRFQDGSGYPLRYSFVAGDALFVSLDDTTIGRLSSAQMAWLDAELTRGADYPVKVVYGHIPLYPFAVNREEDAIGDPMLEALLVRHGVTLFVSGHHHAYYPGRRGPLRLVSMACLGGGQRALIGTTSPSPRSIVVFEIEEGVVRELDAFGGAGFDERIDRTTLPEWVGTGEQRIDRDDL